LYNRTWYKVAGVEPGRLEPKEITENFEEKIGVRDLLPKSAFEASWIMMHFGYGTTSGVAYALAQKTFNLGWRPILIGPTFGALLWAFGYCGWLPLAGLYPPPRQVPKRKVGANILAHVIYGTATARWMLRT
jgi:uncharacterized membrane protein YagU involved in acid resistance